MRSAVASCRLRWPSASRADGDDGIARAPAHRHALDHVRAARLDHERGDVLGEDRSGHHRPRRVARAQRDQVGHRAESRERARGDDAPARSRDTAGMTVDVRPAGEPLPHPARLARLLAQLQLRAAPRPCEHRTRPAHREQRRHRARRSRVRHRTRTATWRSSPGCSQGELAHRDSIGTDGMIYPGPRAAHERRAAASSTPR